MGDSSGMGGTWNNSSAVVLTGKIMVIAIIVFFVVVVLVLFLHLYAKWFWWRVEEPAAPEHHQQRRRRRRGFVFVPGQETAGAAAARRGLDPTVLKSLPVRVFQADDFKEGLECAVCLCELVDGEKARLLPKCNHGFHVDCIDMWFQSHASCPICRNPVGVAKEPVAVDSSAVGPNPVEISVSGGNERFQSTESPNFPTNVLFWGDENRVNSGNGSSSEEGASSSSPSSSLANRTDVALVIDIPSEVMEGLSCLSPAASSCSQDDLKSPVTTRLRSLKRLLSRDRKANQCSSQSTCSDVEQAGRGQPS